MHLKKISMMTIVLGMTNYVQAGDTAGVETFWIWIALFALALIGISILFISSHQARKVQKLHREMFDKQLEMEKNQNLLLTNMSENIHNIAKQALEPGNRSLSQISQPFQTKEEILSELT